MRVQTTAATSTVGQSMATATSAMKAVGAAADPQKMVETMQKFSRRALPLACTVVYRPLLSMCLLRQISRMEVDSMDCLVSASIKQEHAGQRMSWQCFWSCNTWKLRSPVLVHTSGAPQQQAGWPA